MDNKPSSIIDTPISGSHDDLLKVSTYVNALETFLTKADTPLTVAIQGEWGSGKTSFMNQIHEGLCGSQGPFIGIWTHAWEYALLSEPNEILMNMVQGIIRDIEREAKTFGNSLPMSEAFHMARSMFVQVAKMGVQAAAVQAGVPASTSAGLLWNDDKGSSIGLLNESLDKAVHHCLELAEKKGKKGFIFFIDDLDRLEPVVAVQFLELVKNIFELKDCIFVLAIDYDVVVKGLKPRFGARTDENDREFRSFFDKIIQVPFNVPTSSYDLECYLGSSLKKIDFFNSSDLQRKVPLRNYTAFVPGASDKGATYSQIIAAVTNYSTGANPRSIKRMLNTLSLIEILQEGIHSREQQKADPSQTSSTFGAHEKLICFCLVSLQIAYPTFYNLLLNEPLFTDWNEELARTKGYKALTEDEKKGLQDRDEFDEEWELFIFRACQSSSFLKARSSYIANIFNILRGIILSRLPKAPTEADTENNRQKEEEKNLIWNAVISGLGVAAITGLKSSEDQEEKDSYSRIRYNSLEDFEKSIGSHLNASFNLFKEVRECFIKRFSPDFIYFEYMKNKISIKITNNKTYNTIIAKIALRNFGKLKITKFDGTEYTLKKSCMEITEQEWASYINFFNEFSKDTLPTPSLSQASPSPSVPGSTPTQPQTSSASE